MTKSAMEFVSYDLSDLGSDKVCIKMFETVDHWDLINFLTICRLSVLMLNHPI